MADSLFGRLKPRRRRSTKTRHRADSSTNLGFGLPRSLKPANILSSVVNSTINKAVRGFFNSLFRK
ncbi:MAG: hypothetical protein LBO05_13070 [Deltaproteobacteria bacterium]|jgi:hypothetical protein|nr:hypothetical protein [Deltaproteobacteria bacterium]